MPDGPLKAQTGDLKATGGKPPGQRVQGLLDVPDGKPFGSSLTLRYWGSISKNTSDLVGATGFEPVTPRL